MNQSALSIDHAAPAGLDQQWDATVEAFRWLIIFGFPASVAAARVMPELFTDAIDDAVKLARRVTRNPFGYTT